MVKYLKALDTTADIFQCVYCLPGTPIYSKDCQLEFFYINGQFIIIFYLLLVKCKVIFNPPCSLGQRKGVYSFSYSSGGRLYGVLIKLCPNTLILLEIF